jgi:hypothetical protein
MLFLLIRNYSVSLAIELLPLLNEDLLANLDMLRVSLRIEAPAAGWTLAEVHIGWRTKSFLA